MKFTHVDGVLVVRRGVVPEHPVRQAALGPTARVRHVRVVVHLPALASRADLSDACAGVRAPVDRGEDRGAGRATPSCGRSLCVRTLRAVVSRVAPGRACGTGSETAPTFGDTSLARSAWETSGRGRTRLRCVRGSEPFLANHELKNSRVRRRMISEIRAALFPGRDDVPTLLDGSPWRRVDFSEQPRPATSTLSMR